MENLITNGKPLQKSCLMMKDGLCDDDLKCDKNRPYATQHISMQIYNQVLHLKGSSQIILCKRFCPCLINYEN